jgi:hypothetical protein
MREPQILGRSLDRQRRAAPAPGGPLASLLGLPQHPDEHRPKDPVLLAVDQEQTG